MAKHRQADVPDDGDDFDPEELGREAYIEALRLACDPPYPRPEWLPDDGTCRTMSQAELLALVIKHDPDAVDRARGDLERCAEPLRRRRG